MQRLIAAVGLALIMTSLSTAQDRKTFRVGTASAAPGQKVTGVIEVPPGSDGSLNIPVAVVHGTKAGPVLALVAGSHGTEYASIIALEKLIAMLDPAEISGTVIIVPDRKSTRLNSSHSQISYAVFCLKKKKKTKKTNIIKQKNKRKKTKKNKKNIKHIIKNRR